MSRELNFGPYVDVEHGKKTVKDLTYGNPTPEGVVLARGRRDLILPALAPRYFAHRRGRAI